MEWLLEKDGQFLLWLKETCANPILDNIMIFVSALGDGGFLWIALGVLFLLMGFRNKLWRRRGWLLLFSLGANAPVCNLLLKPWVNRIRPYDLFRYEILIPPVGDASFPSGHTSASFAAATVIYTMNKKGGIVAYAFAALMGFSRLYLGVHFPTDVVAGAVVGALMAKVVQWVFRKGDKKISDL